MTSSFHRLIFTLNKSLLQDVKLHLKECDILFNPPLHTYVDVNRYSEKIYIKADRIECWHNEILVGLVAIYLNDLNSEIGFITNVSVLPNYSNLGIAKKMLLISFNEAKKKDYKYVNLEVNTTNNKATSLYEKLGFQIVESKGINQMMQKKLIF